MVSARHSLILILRCFPTSVTSRTGRTPIGQQGKFPAFSLAYRGLEARPRPRAPARALAKNFARQGRAKLVFDMRRLTAPPARNESLQLSVGFWVAAGIGHRLPAGTPRAVNIVAPNLAVAQERPAHHDPRRLHDPGIGR